MKLFYRNSIYWEEYVQISKTLQYDFKETGISHPVIITHIEGEVEIGDELVAYDRDLSEDLISQNKIHYTIRYSNVMGVRSDYIQQEREQLAAGKVDQAVAYTLDQG